MENTVKQTEILEKTGVFDEKLEKRFELSLTYKGTKGKTILVIGINPASNHVKVFDNTTNYLLNNLGMLGYSKIIVWNLFANICTKLKPQEIADNTENMQYFAELLERKFDTVLIGWGNTFLGNKNMEQAKRQVCEQLQPFAEKVMEIVDEEGVYEELHTMHPLFCGQRFSGKWKLRPFIFPTEE